MAKQKEIKFRDRGYVLEGRRGNLTFALYNDNTKEALEEQTYYVVVRHKEIESLGFNTAGYRHFTLDAAKEFCQKITTGEIDPEDLLMEFAAEDMEKEQAAMAASWLPLWGVRRPLAAPAVGPPQRPTRSWRRRRR